MSDNAIHTPAILNQIMSRIFVVVATAPAVVMTSSKYGVRAKINLCTVVLMFSILLFQADACVPPFRNLFDSVEKLIAGSAKRKEIWLEVASSEKDDQKLLKLLTEIAAAGDSAEAIKDG